jgi:hypothetical protein
MSKKNKKLGGFDLDTRPRSSSETLSDEELEMLSASREKSERGELPHYDNSEFAKAKRYAKKNKFTVLFVVMTVLLVIAVIALLSLFLYRELATAPSTEDFKLTLGEDETVIKYKSAMKDDVLYLDVIPIASYTGLIVSGSESSLKLTADDGSYIRFDKGANYAIVNGDKVRLGGEAQIASGSKKEGGEITCRIPFSFIEKMFSYEVEKGTPSVRVRLNTKTNEILIRQVIYTSSEKPLPVHFSIDCFDVIAN